MTGDDRRPLAERLRPERLEDVIGHDGWIGPNGRLTHALRRGQLPSMILLGPPGVGKTTLAHALARELSRPFVALHAADDGIKRLREVLATADRPVLFLDEVHRWTKTQQDALLGPVERGDITLLAATTESGANACTPALRSRLLMVRLEPMDDDALTTLARRGIDRLVAEGWPPMPDALLQGLRQHAAGDARRLLGLLEALTTTSTDLRDENAWRDALNTLAKVQSVGVASPYDLLSAFHKSLRGSDPHAAVYWLARAVQSGMDPGDLARRMVAFASEDVGNADPRALGIATDAYTAWKHLGWPEARLALTQAALWLASAPKSDAAYLAWQSAEALAAQTAHLDVPAHLRSGTTRYDNPHRAPFRLPRQTLWPTGLAPVVLYEPTDHGDEKTLRARLTWWNQRRANAVPHGVRSEEEG